MVSKDSILKRYETHKRCGREYVNKNLLNITTVDKICVEEKRQVSFSTTIQYNLSTDSIYLTYRLVYCRNFIYVGKLKKPTFDEEFFERHNRSYTKNSEDCIKHNKQNKPMLKQKRDNQKRKLLDKYFPLKDFDDIDNHEDMLNEN
jgi:hypothetical protein